MDSTKVNLIYNITNSIKLSDFISMVALIVSILSFFYWYKRINKIEEPNIYNVQFSPDCKIFIKDYSNANNLRIDKVKVKQLNKLFYTEIRFSVSNVNDRLIELKIENLKSLEDYKIIIYTNYKKLHLPIQGYE